MVRRRDFIAGLGGATVLPFAARSQQSAVPVVGWLSTAAPGDWADLVEAFRQGLKEAGYTEGQNVQIEYRWAEGAFDRLPALAADLARRNVSVIFTSGLHLAAQAAKAATATIPIVFVSGNDPVEFGLVASLSRPGGNVTGVSMVSSVLGPKQLALLRELAPKADVLALIVNPANPNAWPLEQQLREAAPKLGVRLEVLAARDEREIDEAFAALVARKAGGLVMANDTALRGRTDQIVALAARLAIPAIYPFRQFTVAGGLMSYGTSLINEMREGGVYTARVLKGARPADLPVLQPTKFEFVINMRTVRALGITIPSGVIAIADEVIE